MDTIIPQKATVEITYDTEEHFQRMMAELFEGIRRGDKAWESFWVWPHCYIKYQKGVPNETIKV